MASSAHRQRACSWRWRWIRRRSETSPAACPRRSAPSRGLRKTPMTWTETICPSARRSASGHRGPPPPRRLGLGASPPGRPLLVPLPILRRYSGMGTGSGASVWRRRRAVTGSRALVPRPQQDDATTRGRGGEEEGRSTRALT